MPNAVTLLIEGAGHSDPLFLSSPKILETMKAFLRGEPVRERVITLPPIAFDPPRKIAQVSDEVLGRYAGTYRLDASMQVRVVKAGSVLYLIPGGNSPVAIRPMSEREFFTPALAATVRFEVEEGRTVALILERPGQPAMRAQKE